jgi:3-hydroxybutyryl-CoA dehydrogenase
MARILLLGPVALVAEFAGMIDERHEVVALVDTAAPMPAHVRIAQSLIDVDETMDVAVDLFIDDHRTMLQTLSARWDALLHARIVVINGLTTTATAASAALRLPGVLSTAFLPGVTATAAHLEVARAMQCDQGVADSAVALLREITGRPVEIVEDRIGLVAPRVLAMVINEAAFAVMEGVASPADIDTAMRLGTSYPVGPLAWADAIGHDTVVRILDALHAEYGEERYRTCVLLRQHARAARAFTAP